MMNMEISLLRELTHVANSIRNWIRREISILSNVVEKGGNLDEIYYSLDALADVDKPLYMTISSDAVKKLVKLQLNTGDKVREEGGGVRYIDDYLEGGYPHRYRGGSRFIRGGYPPIDSTCYALLTISRYVVETGYMDDDIDGALRRGVKYLARRDVNRDGLLEQVRGEDWLPEIGREGGLLYINSLYLKTLEDLYYIYVDKDGEFSQWLKNKLSKTYDSIKDLLWTGRRFFDGVAPTSGRYTSYSVDSFVTSKSITIDREFIKNHLKNAYSRLYNEEYKLLNITSSMKYLEYGYLNKIENIVSIPHTIYFASSLVDIGLYKEAVKIVGEAFKEIKTEKIVIYQDGRIRKIKSENTSKSTLTILRISQEVNRRIKG